jgi:hypothetical protein
MTTATATTTRDAMLEKVRKLFAKADNVAGTPEADIFNAKAYDLIAKYGIDETAARERAGEGPAPITTVDVTIMAPYVTEQRTLLQVLARALHCSPLYMPTRGNRALYRDIIVGTAMHTDRVQILYSMLMPQMLAGAAGVSPHEGSRVGIKAYRRSWMRGFINEVGNRLAAAEKTAADAQPGTGLVLLTDAKRAEAQLKADIKADGGRIGSIKSKNWHDETAHGMGKAAGSKVNLGGTAVNGARALPA